MASSLQKMLAVLDLFDERALAWTADSVCERLAFSTSSGYRYLRELCSAGLLTRTPGGTYVLGMRIMELDYLMRRGHPLVRIGQPVLRQLADGTGCDVLLSSIHGLHIVNILHERGSEQLNPSYLEGRQHPLFRGAAAKAILPHLPRSTLVRLHARHADAIAAAGMGAGWVAFRKQLQAIRRAGYSYSSGELDPDMSGLGTAVVAHGSVIGSLTVVFSNARGRVLSRDGIVAQMQAAAAQLASAVEAGPPPTPGGSVQQALG